MMQRQKHHADPIVRSGPPDPKEYPMTHRIRRFLAGAAASSALAAAVVAVAAAPAQAEPSADCHTGTTLTSGTRLKCWWTIAMPWASASAGRVGR